MNVSNDVYIYRDFEKAKSEMFAFKDIPETVYFLYKRQGNAKQASEVPWLFCEDALRLKSTKLCK